MMQKSPDEAARNARVREMFTACQDALKIIGNSTNCIDLISFKNDY